MSGAALRNFSGTELSGNYRTQIPYIAAHRASWQSPRVRLDYIKVFGDGNEEVGLSSVLNHDGPPETERRHTLTHLCWVAPEELHKTRVLMTFLDGALIYELPPGAASRQWPRTRRGFN